MIIALDTSQKLTQLREIVWPVYKLGDKQPIIDNGLVYYYTEYTSETNESSLTLKIVDDKSVPQTTLGKRRLHIGIDKGAKLFPIRTAIYLLADLIKLAKASTWFIDDSGRIFQYKKYTRAKLITRKIKQVLPATGIGCVLEIEGMVQRFKSMHHPNDYQQWVVLLYINKTYIFYGLSESELKPSWRLV
jgi:hypothetical protein